ncbi:isoprenylcysteine carboxylmethyltransferase family protein [Aestuariibacter sp. AA17]|uniref:Isoprenylcysteine carboxylmethyltransferase family protein n=1 Tax=Fluctibacter corallii TaxID=2984329 RepID=A0ABT3A3V0_9ALTE|nr:isoprenylcysteine carboxylmethyltransferase family protein [Aestuariibacter sp. AA17]MCV2883365.1 isoprenylcysteine carboxylmethyltransferase family protein [Aestuariibacter sp. AA17]
MESSVDTYIAIYLAGFFTFVAVFYLLLAKIQKKRLGKVTLIHRGPTYSAHWFNHMTFNVFRYAIWFVCMAIAFDPQSREWIGEFESMGAVWIHLLGCAILTLGFLFAISASLLMKASWRSGIDDSGPDVLLTSALYGVSRNPNFLGVMVAQLGFFLALPSVFTLVCLVVGWICIHRQVIFEEKHLQQHFGSTYHSYMRRVPRWL